MKLFTTATAVVLVLLSSLCPAYAAEGGAGTTIYQNQMELSGGATYTNTISQNSTYGIQESYSFTTTPGDIVTPIILACDTIYGSMNINSIVSYAQKLGYNVLAAMNTDFFSMSTGVPLGIVIENGVYKCSSLRRSGECVCSGKHGGADQDDKSGRGRKRIRRFPGE